MSLRILVVDDEPQILAALKRLFTRSGHEVSTALTAEDALARLEAFNPDVVVSDFKLPKMSGAQLLTAVSAARPSVRRVLLSGFAEMAGCAVDGVFVRKPWNDADLLALCASSGPP